MNTLVTEPISNRLSARGAGPSGAGGGRPARRTARRPTSPPRPPARRAGVPGGDPLDGVVQGWGASRGPLSSRPVRGGVTAFLPAWARGSGARQADRPREPRALARPSSTDCRLVLQDRAQHAVAPAVSGSAQQARRAAVDAVSRLGRWTSSTTSPLSPRSWWRTPSCTPRTSPFLSPPLETVRVAVTDGSQILPGGTPSSRPPRPAAACCLVAGQRPWGVEALPTGGKCVSAELHAATAGGEPTAPRTSCSSSGRTRLAAPSVPGAGVDVAVEVEVEAMLASRAPHRRARAGVRSSRCSTPPTAALRPPATTQVLALARQLDVANEHFHEAQTDLQPAISARKHRQGADDPALCDCVTATCRARRWLTALDAATP